jgi:hypothetical protein
MFRHALYSRLLSPFGTRVSQYSAMHRCEPPPHRSLPAVFPHKPLPAVFHWTENIRLAIRSIFGAVIISPLSVNDVAIELATAGVPLRSLGVTPVRHYYEDIRLPLNHWASSWLTSCATRLPNGRIQRISRVPDSTWMTCHGLRPRWTLGCHGSGQLWFRLPHSLLGQHPHVHSITGLNPFTLPHCSPSSLCVRFAVTVTGADATLDTQCLTRASGTGTCTQPVEPSFARRTRNPPHVQTRDRHLHRILPHCLREIAGDTGDRKSRHRSRTR